MYLEEAARSLEELAPALSNVVVGPLVVGFDSLRRPWRRLYGLLLKQVPWSVLLSSECL